MYNITILNWETMLAQEKESFYKKGGGIMYRIVRFYRDGRRSRTIKFVSTLERAQLHCSDPKTRKEGEWFDGYTKCSE